MILHKIIAIGKTNRGVRKMPAYTSVKRNKDAAERARIDDKVGGAV